MTADVGATTAPIPRNVARSDRVGSGGPGGDEGAVTPYFGAKGKLGTKAGFMQVQLARRACLRTFPVAVSGRRSRTSTIRGYL